MTDFPLHTAETAPAPAGDTLRGIERARGSVPDPHAELAEAPVAIEGHGAVFDAHPRSSFTPSEQQVVTLAIGHENGRTRCMAGHSVLAARAGLDSGVVEALREGTQIADPRPQAPP